ncbi:MAG: 50S ribosomal protein L6 [Candidatus Marinimicrobia bacterium]|jgi:large subunit ribosomal protein L6|nr:50S ribosomal protein L6 [Candidatus Neomarinimicrobiota bacterium]MBT3496676.1 50S ribosomal protein L6 [Candidatus Neomarinimicrobiota bacterium]MBT3692980.1 50S ribosomal protein L6 [Candidatus Neomarinimicrobiota bacterium]MBT3731951.1 50S ribosomal protein L6 [Candidatus Neomarinimicrobiota bacterium]MBT4144430.1 50S ribosomal protein L6 [Candidatus Neomarinimicrobiota bacterium]
MSRIGNNPVPIPEGVKVNIEGFAVNAMGPKGSQTVHVHQDMKIELKEDKIVVSRPSDQKLHRALHGTTRQIINNAIVGVSEGFSKELEIRGVGYQASLQGKRLLLQLGYSHDIFFEIPEGITVTADRTAIKVEGIDKQLVGAVSAKIRSFRKPEPYKGKGVRYKDEFVKTKQGKTVGGVG